MRVSSPPVKGKANEELVLELGKLLNAKVRLVSGEKSRKKRIEISGKTLTEIKELIKDLNLKKNNN